MQRLTGVFWAGFLTILCLSNETLLASASFGEWPTPEEYELLVKDLTDFGAPLSIELLSRDARNEVLNARTVSCIYISPKNGFHFCRYFGEVRASACNGATKGFNAYARLSGEGGIYKVESLNIGIGSLIMPGSRNEHYECGRFEIPVD